MFKKILVAIIVANMCFSSLAYAQQGNTTELTAEEVALLMTSLDAKPKELHPAVWIGGGAAVILGAAYMVRKMIKNPELGKYYVAAMDPRAYNMLLQMGKTQAEKATMKASVEGAKTMTAEAGKHTSKLKNIAKGNYWRSVDAAYTMYNPGTGVVNVNVAAKGAAELEKTIAKMSRAEALLASPKQLNKYWPKVKKTGKWGLAFGLIAYTIWGGDDSVQEGINSNRVVLEREIKRLMVSDADSLALMVYNLPEDQKQVAYGIIADSVELFTIIKQQVEEAKSIENINFVNEVEKDTTAVDYVKELKSLNHSDHSSIKGWVWGN